MDNTIEVYSNGYVRLVDVMGSDLSVVNAARASFAKESKEIGPKDGKLIDFLANHGHTSPFRHAFATFEIKAPLMVARQWWKYVCGSDHTMDAWNEASRRYITIDTEFYVPESWRTAAADKKQGSSEPVSAELGTAFTKMYKDHIAESERLYKIALDAGVCPEQARLFLPANGLQTIWRWSGSLQSIAHMLNQRLASDAQVEFQKYAEAVRKLIEPHFPLSIKALVKV